MNADWMKTRQTKYSAYVTVYILVVVARARRVQLPGQRCTTSRWT